MPDVTVDFEAPDLAARVEQLSHEQIDQLPFGAILLDNEGIVLFYSAAERRLSGYPGEAVGKNFFEIARCFGKVDLRARAQSARQGGFWLFLQRD